jgi:hypothetical protein
MKVEYMKFFSRTTGRPWTTNFGKSALYNKIVMVVLEIMSAQTMVTGTTDSISRGIYQQYSLSRQLSSISRKNAFSEEFLETRTIYFIIVLLEEKAHSQLNGKSLQLLRTAILSPNALRHCHRTKNDSAICLQP